MELYNDDDYYVELTIYWYYTLFTQYKVYTIVKPFDS